MKQLITIIIAVAAGGALVWFIKTRDTGDETVTTKSPPAAAGPAAATPAPTATTAVPGAVKSPSEADKVAAALKDHVVVNLGKVEDIGQRTGSMLLAQKELDALLALDAGARTPEQTRRMRELDRQRANTLGMLPEIAQFQDNPDEYARFCGSLLTEAGKLNAAQSKVVTEYMRTRGQEMVTAGLNAAKEPTEAGPQEAWEEKRDAFNEDTVEGVEKLLPPGEAERIGFTDKFMELMEQDFDKAK